ncbi:MAG: carbonate dehydratase [Betaproteobacteria bacterium]|nr:carbonate dehydratase [Betaproteobacteria bacterium]
MDDISHLFELNRRWAKSVLTQDPDFFNKLAQQQTPEYLWIGCSDSRVPANTVAGLLPGEVFVHRNVANVVVHSDMNCLSVLQFAVDVLRVRHIIVCGHYGCSGVKAALQRQRIGISDNWLRYVRDVEEKHISHLAALADVTQHDRLCELNVIEQVAHVCETSIVRDAWERNQPVTVHGFIYGIHDGLLRDLGMTVGHPTDMKPQYASAVAALKLGGGR